MDLKTSNYLLHPQGVGVRKDDAFDASFIDPVLKETGDFEKLFPMAKKDGGTVTKNMVEAPPTPGRPVFSFSVVGSRKNFPSKWDDAEKWLISGSDSPAHKNSGNQQENHHKTEKTVSKPISVSKEQEQEQDHRNSHTTADSSHVLLKDKFTNGSEPNVSRFKCLVPINQGFLFTAMKDASTEVVEEVKPPIKSLSPQRHNTPASMSGPLALNSSFDIAELQECHLAKLQLQAPFDSVTCNWSSRVEEEEDISKSLRLFEMNNEQAQKSLPPDHPTACAWEKEETTKSNLRSQREEAKIQAWVNLQNAKAEAQCRKLEVKIQKMRWKFEEKMMRKMASVDRRAEELRAAAQLEIQKASSKKSSISGCFPCTSTVHP